VAPSCLLFAEPLPARGPASSGLGARGQLVPSGPSAPPSSRAAAQLCSGAWPAPLRARPPCWRELEQLEHALIGPPASAPAGHAGLQRDWLLQFPWRVCCSNRPDQVGAAVPRSWPVAGCSTCAAAANSEATLDPLPANGRDREAGQGLGPVVAAERPAADRGRSCGFAAVAQPHHRRTCFAWRSLLKAAAELAAARAFLLWLLGPLSPLAWGHRSGRGGVARNRLRVAATAITLCQRTPRGSGGPSDPGPAGPAPALVIRRAVAVPLTSQADGGPVCPAGAQAASAAADLLMALAGPTRSPVGSAAPGGAAWRRSCRVAGWQTPARLRRHALRQKWLGLRAAAPARGLAAGRRTLSGRGDLLLNDPELPPCLADARGLLSPPSPAGGGTRLPFAARRAQALLHLEALREQLACGEPARLIQCPGAGLLRRLAGLRRYLLVQELLGHAAWRRLAATSSIARQRWSEWFRADDPRSTKARAHLPAGRGIDQALAC